MKLKKVEDLQEFDKFVQNHIPANIMQTSSWAQVKNDDWQAHYLFFEKDNKIIGSAMLLARKVFKNNHLFYAPRGPILNYENEDEVKQALALLKKYVKENNGFVLKFDPEIPLKRTNLRENLLLEDNTKTYEMLSKLTKHTGFDLEMNSTFQPRFQMVINLETDLLDKLKAKRRRLFKEEYLTQRGFQVIEDTSEHGVKEFARLSLLTEERQSISLRNEAYFMKMYNAFKEKNEIKLFFVELNIDKLIEFHEDDEAKIEELNKIKSVEGNIIRTNAILCVYGTSMVQMFYAGNDIRFSRYELGYSLIYTASKLAREANYLTFNLGGVKGSLDDGLFDFKSKFHPELYEYLGDFDLIVNPLIYKAFNSALTLKKKLKGKK